MALKCTERIILRGFSQTQLVRNISFSPVCRTDSKNDAANKLHNLLQSIIKDDSLQKDSNVASSSSTVAPKIKKSAKQYTTENLGSRIVKSAEKVAEGLPGKPKETEAQLLQKLLFKDKSLTNDILKAAAGKEALEDLLSNMPVEKRKGPLRERPNIPNAEYDLTHKMRDAFGRKIPLLPKRGFVPDEKVDLYNTPRLEIFEAEKLKSDEVKLNTWNGMRKRDLKLLTTHPPRNIYEQMMIWTERGILWKFPIDNEYGLEEEKNTDFSEHVFLENYIEDWCPERGPVRHFMELVCVGLSQNYWLSAKEKKEHIMWYKEFFINKKALLNEIGAGTVKESAPQLN